MPDLYYFFMYAYDKRSKHGIGHMATCTDYIIPLWFTSDSCSFIAANRSDVYKSLGIYQMQCHSNIKVIWAINLKCFALIIYCKLSMAIPRTISNEPQHDKTNKVSVRPEKTQISLGIRPVWSESSLSAWRKLGSLATHWTHSEDSDQTGRTVTLLVLSCRGSNNCSNCWSAYAFLLLWSHYYITCRILSKFRMIVRTLPSSDF